MQALKKIKPSGSVSLSTHAKKKLRPEPVWILRYRCAKHPNGTDKQLGPVWTKRGRPPEGYFTETQAQIKAEQFLAELSETAPGTGATVGRATEMFLARCRGEIPDRRKRRRRALMGSTIHEYTRIANLICALPNGERTWGETSVAHITSDHVSVLLDELESRNVADGTYNHWFTVLNGIFDDLQLLNDADWYWITPDDGARGKYTFLSPEEVALLKIHARSDLDRALYTVATEAGLRLSELLGLAVKNVILNGEDGQGKIFITQAFTRRGGLAGPKSHHVRSIPMSDNVRDTLLPYCQGKGPEAFVFNRGFDDMPLDHYKVWRSFKRALKDAGLPDIRFHDLRHTFASLVMGKFQSNQVQEFLGHADLKTTQRYLHTTDDPEASAKISSVFISDRQRIENVVALQQRNIGGRPPTNGVGNCPKCGEPKAPGQPYCAEHQREARRASASRKAAKSA